MASNKYLLIGDKGVTVKIEKTDFLYIKEFHYRLNGGKEEAIRSARKHRDSIHKATFGHPVGSRFFHSKKKQSKTNTQENLLPPGISYGYSRGKLLYIVASWSPEPNNIQRKRFNVKIHGIENALDMAISFRSEIINKLVSN